MSWVLGRSEEDWSSYETFETKEAAKTAARTRLAEEGFVLVGEQRILTVEDVRDSMKWFGSNTIETLADTMELWDGWHDGVSPEETEALQEELLAAVCRWWEKRTKVFFVEQIEEVNG